MKLTKTARETFIDRVMDDVPAINYEQQIEDAVRQDSVPTLTGVVDAFKAAGWPAEKN